MRGILATIPGPRSVIALLLACQIFSALASDPATLPPPLSEKDVLDRSGNRIDVHAQRAIVRLSNGNREQKFTAYYILRNVNSGILEGIYIVDQGVPALRAQALGKGWWTLLEGRPARCWNEPAHEKPMIILGKQTVTQAAVLDAALVESFRECGFREVEVVVSRGGIPCTDAFVSFASEPIGVRSDRPCHATTQGLCRFALPPAMYGFSVTCDSQPTSPPEIFRAVAPGQGVQTEPFSF